MAPYPKEITAALKRVLMCRRDNGYRFAPEDFPELTATTGLSRTDITRWAHYVHDYYVTPARMAKYFETNGPAENVQVSQCHVACWNTDMDAIQRLWDSDLYRFVAYGISENLGVAQLFVDFKKRSYTRALTVDLEALGCTEISITTFANDGARLAGSALHSVHKIGRREQYVGGSFGACSAALTRRAEEKRAEEEPKRCTCGAAEVDDIVKKRKWMEAEQPEFDGDTDPDALAQFEAFSAAVWPALESVCKQSAEIRLEDEVWLKQQQLSAPNKKRIRKGFVYAAWNPSFQEVVKIGATCRDTPYARLKELSGSDVPQKFELVACVPTADPFAVEKYVHSYFEKFRIKKGDKMCEFFQISREIISDFFSRMIQDE